LAALLTRRNPEITAAADERLIAHFRRNLRNAGATVRCVPDQARRSACPYKHRDA
jgi:hypothetical protein